MLTLKNTGSLFFCQKLKKVAGRQFSEAKKTSCQTKKPAGSQKNGLPKLASRRVGAKKTSWQIENKASRKLREPTSDGLRPTSDGLQATSDGLRPTSDGLQPTSDGPTSDGLQPTATY